MPTRNVVLTKRQETLIEALVQSGRYQNASEVMREGLRLVENREVEEAAKLDALRSAAAIGVSALERGEFTDIAAFGRHIASARVTDVVDDALRREIAYASDGGEVAMTYSLRDMTLLERRIDGAVYAPPRSRVGALDGGGAQFVVSDGGAIEAGSARALSEDALWLFADDDTRTYVVVKCSDRAGRVALHAGDTRVECDAIGFVRIELDAGAGAVSIETSSEPGAVRVQSAAAMTVTVNGAVRDGSSRLD